MVNGITNRIYSQLWSSKLAWISYDWNQLLQPTGPWKFGEGVFSHFFSQQTAVVIPQVEKKILPVKLMLISTHVGSQNTQNTEKKIRKWGWLRAVNFVPLKLPKYNKWLSFNFLKTRILCLIDTLMDFCDWSFKVLHFIYYPVMFISKYSNSAKLVYSWNVTLGSTFSMPILFSN